MRTLAVGWLCGTLWLQYQASLPAPAIGGWLPMGGLLAAAFVGACPRLHAYLRVALLLAAGVTLGASWSGWRAAERLAEALPPELEGTDLRITGVVADLPESSAIGRRFVFSVEQAEAAGQRVALPRRVALGWYGAAPLVPQLLPGERWRLTVRLKRPHGLANPDGFDVEAWWLTEGIRANGYVRPAGAERLDSFVFSWRDLVGRARACLRERIASVLPEGRYAGVLVALVIGDQRAIAQADWEMFNRTGIGHLMSISGLHITMIAALAAGMMGLLWRHGFWVGARLPLYLPAQKVAAASGLAAALIYVALAGFGIPAQRTLLMLAVVTLALWRARIVAASQVLSLALLAVLVLDPWAVLWPGFWLSFFAIACLMLASRSETGSMRSGWRQVVTGGMQSQFVATVGLLPLTMLLFAQVSVIGPIANALAIPLVSFIITPLALLGSVLPAPLHGWLLHAAHFALTLLAEALRALSGLPLAVWQAPKPGLLVTALAIAGALWLLAPRGWPWRWAGVLAWLPLLAATPTAPHGGVWLTAFDIGQGNAVLVETPSFRLLYDTGPAYSAESDGASRVILPYLRARGIDRLDALVISHGDSDHAGGARSLLAQLQIGWIASSLPDSRALLQSLQSDRHVDCTAGQRWRIDGVEFEFLHPAADDRHETRPNARSCVLRIQAGAHAALLAGDIEARQERLLLARSPEKLRADVLLAPHHGSGTSSTPAFLDAVRPSLALFQLGYRNRYRHPKTEVVARYQARGVHVLRSDQAGAVRVSLDGSGVTAVRQCEKPRYWSSRRCAAAPRSFAQDR